MKNQTFGIEIETVYASTYRPGRPLTGRVNAYRLAADTVKGVVGGTVGGGVLGHGVSRASVKDSKNRTWDICSDGSVGGGTSVEFVSPPLRYEDIEELQEVVRAIRQAGFKVNRSCGIHVHVGSRTTDGEELSGKALKVLAKTMKSKERIIKKATKRLANRWCRDLETDLVERIVRAGNDKNAVGRAWYGVRNFAYAAQNHYHDSRYHALNLHSVFFRGTVEFRMFESSLHAGKVKAYIQFSLALVGKARKARGASAQTNRSHNNDKYTLRVFMNHLGLKGDEFKTVRHHLLNNLEGSASYRTRAQQDAGHERERAANAA